MVALVGCGLVPQLTFFKIPHLLLPVPGGWLASHFPLVDPEDNNLLVWGYPPFPLPYWNHGVRKKFPPNLWV
jgi:hypothetical protein